MKVSLLSLPGAGRMAAGSRSPRFAPAQNRLQAVPSRSGQLSLDMGGAGPDSPPAHTLPVVQCCSEEFRPSCQNSGHTTHSGAVGNCPEGGWLLSESRCSVLGRALGLVSRRPGLSALSFRLLPLPRLPPLLGSGHFCWSQPCLSSPGWPLLVVTRPAAGVAGPGQPLADAGK